MSRSDELRDRYAVARRQGVAIAGLYVHSVLEAEAAAAAAASAGTPVVLMVPAARPNLGPFVRALRALGAGDGRVFLQIVGDDPARLAALGRELDVDAVGYARGDEAGARALCAAACGGTFLTEVTLPWRQAEDGELPEGRVVDIAAARAVVNLAGLDVAAVPVGGGPGPYKTWRMPLWSLEAFTDAVGLRDGLSYALPYASLLPKDLLQKYNAFGGALPGVISLPHQQFRSFIAAGAVKVNFRSDCALAFLAGLRQSLVERPESIDVFAHLMRGVEELVAFLCERLADLRR